MTSRDSTPAGAALNDHLPKSQQEAEANAARLEERYRAVFQQAFEMIFLVAPDTAIIDANASACRILGYAPDEMVRLHARDVVHAEDLANAPLRFATIPAGGVIVSERRFVRKDGSVVHGELTTKALMDGSFQVVVRDVTERKEVQAQLLLADRLASLGRLASGVAHEVNNPLAYVMLNLEFLDRYVEELPAGVGEGALARMRSAVEHAREGAERMRRIIRMLGAFGRGEEECLGPVDVNAVIDSAADIAAIQLRHGTRITRRYDANVPVSANAFRLGQVFVNLLVNAGDALREGPVSNEIGLRTYVRSDGRVVAEVTDNGAGIPRDIQARIFDPFFTTKPVGKGTGLGLSVCHTIVTALGGEIACESTPGKGTTFRVVLNQAAAVGERAPAERAPLSSAARGRILVVDDDARVARAMAAALDGNDVVVASGGREALDRLQAEPFDCVLCDVMMPDVSGIDVHEELLRQGRGMERRVVFVTGGAVTESAHAALAQTTNPVLEKPVEASLLRAVAAATIERASCGDDR